MPEEILDNEIIDQIKNIFSVQLVHPVEILLFISNESCYSCKDTNEILAEIVSTTDKIHLSTYDVIANRQLIQNLNINHTPGILVRGFNGDKYTDYNFRFYGIPSGYEFSSLIYSILLISKHDSGLSDEIRKDLKGINKPVNLKLFVTPT